MRPYLKNINHTKKEAGGVAQGVGPEFKPQLKKRTNPKKIINLIHSHCRKLRKCRKV
jgi:hypothetical protein